MAEYIKRMDTFSDEMCEDIDCGVCPFYNKAGENDCQVVAFLRAIPAADVVPASDFRDCRNELCLKCGAYTQKHLGACDGCRWRSDDG